MGAPLQSPSRYHPPCRFMPSQRQRQHEASDARKWKYDNVHEFETTGESKEHRLARQGEVWRGERVGGHREEHGSPARNSNHVNSGTEILTRYSIIGCKPETRNLFYLLQRRLSDGNQMDKKTILLIIIIIRIMGANL